VVGINANYPLLAAAFGGALVGAWGLKKMWNSMQRGEEINLTSKQMERFQQQISNWNSNYDSLSEETKFNLAQSMAAWRKLFSDKSKRSMPNLESELDELERKFKGEAIEAPAEQTTMQRASQQLQEGRELLKKSQYGRAMVAGGKAVGNILYSTTQTELMSKAEAKRIRDHLQRLLRPDKKGRTGFLRLPSAKILETRDMLLKYAKASDAGQDIPYIDTQLMMQHLQDRSQHKKQSDAIHAQEKEEQRRLVAEQLAKHKEQTRGGRGGQKTTPMRIGRGHPTTDPEAISRIGPQSYQDPGDEVSDEYAAHRDEVLNILRSKDDFRPKKYAAAFKRMRDVYERKTGNTMSFKDFEEWSMDLGGHTTLFSDRDEIIEGMYDQFVYLNTNDHRGNPDHYLKLFDKYLAISDDLRVRPEYKTLDQFEWNMKQRPDAQGLTETNTGKGLKAREGGRDPGGGDESSDPTGSGRRDKRGRGKGKGPRKRSRRRSKLPDRGSTDSEPSGVPGSSISARFGPGGGKKKKYVDDPDRMTLALLSSMIQQKQPQVIPVATGSSGIVQVPMRQPIRPPEKQKPQIVVKQTVKQVQGPDKPKRRKRKAGVGKSRKEYNAIKKEVKSRLTAQKNVTFEKHNARIKKLPAKERAAARKKLRAELKARHSRLVKQLRTGKSLKTIDAITAAIRVAKRIKW
jgi:hypothetical protein